MATRHKDLNRAAKLARKLGWEIISRNGHEYWTAPNGGRRVTVSSSPSDVNAGRQALRDLRKAGLPV